MMRQDMVRMAEAVNRIKMKPEMEKEILRNLKRMQDGEEIGRLSPERGAASQGRRKAAAARRPAWRQAVAAAAVCVLTVSLAGAPVKAFVESLVRERMEQIPEEELADTAQMIQENSVGVDADVFSRPFTEAEQGRMRELERQYLQGRFPDGTLPEAADDAAVPADTFCYSRATSTYFMPERELTDEELLQYLDFQQKLAYALTGDARQERERQLAEAAGAAVAAEGISLAQAEAIAGELMASVFGKDAAGYEKNSYLYCSQGDESGFVPMDYETIKYKNQYMVNFCAIHDYHYFYIDVETGNVALVSHNYSPRDAEKMLPGEAESLLAEAQLAAEELLRDGFHRTEEIARVYGEYVVDEEGFVVNGELGFHFVTEDGTDFCLVLDGRTKELMGYRDTYYEEYRKAQEAYEEALREKYRDYGEKLPIGNRVLEEME